MKFIFFTYLLFVFGSVIAISPQKIEQRAFIKLKLDSLSNFSDSLCIRFWENAVLETTQKIIEIRCSNYGFWNIYTYTWGYNKITIRKKIVFIPYNRTKLVEVSEKKHTEPLIRIDEIVTMLYDIGIDYINGKEVSQPNCLETEDVYNFRIEYATKNCYHSFEFNNPELCNNQFIENKKYSQIICIFTSNFYTIEKSK
ncbi:MAG: hypothetical protein SNJ71_05025 [Bacteroidales bacterium]